MRRHAGTLMSKPAAAPKLSPGGRGEKGQVTAMLVLFAICVLLAVIAVTDISASYLRRQATTSLADGAALAATEAAAAGSIYASPAVGYVAIDEAAAAAAVDTYLHGTGAYTDYPGLRAAVEVEGFTVRVALTMPYELPVMVPGVRDTTTIHATGSAVLPID
ncbi:MAG: pilus assembly protein TadG-related protein [Nocardioidaceae bacterium]